MQELIGDLYDVIILTGQGELRSPGPLTAEAAKAWAAKVLSELDDVAEVEYRPSSQMRLV